MRYNSSESFRQALEGRIRDLSATTGLSIDRLRRRVLMERILSRLEQADPGLWVLKGGMALEVRLAERARLTKDIDLALREDVATGDVIADQLLSALTQDSFGDRFTFAVSVPELLQADGGGHVTWRVRVDCSLSGRAFGTVKMDISPRTHEVHATDRLVLPNSLEFAGVEDTVFEVVDINRHAAEKFHGMTREFGDRENSRVRDLADLVILIDNGLLDVSRLRASALDVWRERNQSLPPNELPALPALGTSATAFWRSTKI
jgi:predicted nucleotidyltransferase component of viral defense system